MGPLWQVHHILNTEYENVPPRDFAQGYTAKLRRRLKMTVPDILVMTGQMECVDILKVFVTARQTSFLSLELPKVEVALEEKKLKSLPSRLSVTASSVEASEDWAALIFVIRTRLRSA
jgi:hypothetical protein